MANPWCKPLYPFEMKHLCVETALMVLAHLFKTNDGVLDPIVDVLLLNVHVDMEDPTCRFESQQRGFPNCFTRR